LIVLAAVKGVRSPCAATIASRTATPVSVPLGVTICPLMTMFSDPAGRPVSPPKSRSVSAKPAGTACVPVFWT